MELAKAQPAYTTFSYMHDLTHSERRDAVKRYSQSSLDQIQNIEDRIAKTKSEHVSFRRRAYRALLAISHMDEILRIAKAFDINWDAISAKNGLLMREIVREIAQFYIETELTLKLEGRIKAIDENHLRDMNNATSVLPYCDIAVFEKDFASLMQQCALGQKYKCEVITELTNISELLQPS